MTAGTERGQVVRDADGVRLVFHRRYPQHRVGDVWSALVEPDRLAAWYGRWTGDPASGTVHITMSADADPELVVIDACVARTRLALTLGSGDGPWPVVLSLSEHEGGTSLEFVHHLSEPYDASSIGPGWHYYLDRLAAVLAGTAVPDDFDDYFPAPADSYRIPPPA